ncbi:hypothetical protein WNB94_09190 [Aquabacterium sp. A3]|uniref:hypothetical protein n=1 Tax=Aquabacterium sp. A3 TaxID=3132829 RepID=UPI00311A57B0
MNKSSTVPALKPDERKYYRDKLRAARYAALADSEGFEQICYALEALGMRLHQSQADLGTYRNVLRQLAGDAPQFSFAFESTHAFKSFDALFNILRCARNDAMHTGARARTATQAATELCVGLEEALMANQPRRAGDLMVKGVVSVEPWQMVAEARQLMLMHSFSYLPILHQNQWKLLSDVHLARFLASKDEPAKSRRNRLALSIKDAVSAGHQGVHLSLESAKQITPCEDVGTLVSEGQSEQKLWLVCDERNHLLGKV